MRERDRERTEEPREAAARLAEAGAAGDGGDELARRARSLLDLGDELIRRALSGDSRRFLAQNRQQGGE